MNKFNQDSNDGGQSIKGVSLVEGQPVLLPDKSFAEKLRAQDLFCACNAQKDAFTISVHKAEGLFTRLESVEGKPSPEPKKRGRPRKTVKVYPSSDKKDTPIDSSQKGKTT